MSMARLLRNAANLYMAGVIAKLVAADLAAELARGVAAFGTRSDAWISRSPYQAAGVALSVGILTGRHLAAGGALRR